jgi:5'-deoxynucleotidase YfbR-like HD superfamily hydrolase
VENPETVQEHTVALKVLASSILDLLTEFAAKDKEDLLEILEVHDWPESIIGDEVNLTNDPEERKRLKEDKFRRERDAMVKITKNLGSVGENILNLWLRFETPDDLVASLARQLDKYQSIEKAFEYEKAQGIPLFKEFRDYYLKDITHPVLVQRMAGLSEKER